MTRRNNPDYPGQEASGFDLESWRLYKETIEETIFNISKDELFSPILQDIHNLCNDPNNENLQNALNAKFAEILGENLLSTSTARMRLERDTSNMAKYLIQGHLGSPTEPTSLLTPTQKLAYNQIVLDCVNKLELKGKEEEKDVDKEIQEAKAEAKKPKGAVEKEKSKNKSKSCIMM